MGKIDNQLARMQSLMTYGTVTESKNAVSKNFETRMLGADGKSYAIIRENSHYYIKTAPKDRESILEAYDYIGGWNNRKDYEYDSYTNALKNFTLKLRSLNEAYDREISIETLDPFKKEDLVIEGTDAMKNEIARVRQIMHNTSVILNEGQSGIGKTPITDQPESKHKDSGDKDAPFTIAGKYEENRDGKTAKKHDLDKDNTKAHVDNGEKDTKHTGKRGDEGYKKVSSDLDGKDIATEKKGGYKQPANLSEGCCGNCEAENGVVSDCMKNWGVKDHGQGPTVWDEADMDEININEENLEGNDWGSEGVPASAGVGEVGDDAPFDKPVNEGCDEAGCCQNECGMLEGDDDVEISDDKYADDAELGDEEDLGGEEFGDEEGLGNEDELGDEEYLGDEEELGDEDALDDADADFGEGGEDEGFEDYDDEDETIDEEDPDAVRAEIERLQAVLADLEGGEEGEDLGGEEELGDEEGEDLGGEEELGDEGEDLGGGEELGDEEEPVNDEELMYEAKQRFMQAIVENAVKMLKEDTTVLHDFGKHPGYRKKVMSLPATGEDKNEHGEDWNDDSVHNEQPFGQKIGSSAPFDEKVVKMITDAVINEIKKKSK